MRHACAFVASKYPARTTDRLTHGADIAGDFGFEALKLYATPAYSTAYPNQNWETTHTTLVSLAQDAAYEAVLGDARFNRFFINTWTFANGINNKWINDWNNGDDAAEESELYDFCVHLLSTYSNKEFVIQNWEGDWALLGAFDPTVVVTPDRMQRMAQYLRARQRAVTRARAAVASTSKLIHSVEVNRCLDKFSGRVHELLDQVRPDAVSFSAYESINTYGSSQAEAEANIEARLTQSVRTIKRVLGNNVRLYIGEYGWPEAESGFASLGLDLGDLIQKVSNVGDALGITDCVFWQLYDNEEQSPGVPRGFYVYDETGALSEQGTKLAALI